MNCTQVNPSPFPPLSRDRKYKTRKLLTIEARQKSDNAGSRQNLYISIHQRHNSCQERDFLRKKHKKYVLRATTVTYLILHLYLKKQASHLKKGVFPVYMLQVIKLLEGKKFSPPGMNASSLHERGQQAQRQTQLLLAHHQPRQSLGACNSLHLVKMRVLRQGSDSGRMPCL